MVGTMQEHYDRQRSVWVGGTGDEAKPGPLNAVVSEGLALDGISWCLMAAVRRLGDQQHTHRQDGDCSPRNDDSWGQGIQIRMGMMM
jgi:hypothetical protein